MASKLQTLIPVFAWTPVSSTPITQTWQAHLIIGIKINLLLRCQVFLSCLNVFAQLLQNIHQCIRSRKFFTLNCQQKLYRLFQHKKYLCLDIKETKTVSIRSTMHSPKLYINNFWQIGNLKTSKTTFCCVSLYHIWKL